ncbi:MAG: (Fe-S)-binding protein [Desulfobacteraceae bacterium]|nr:MAG: (Fe-S)-binding protein [Desulfobacteraceae bacterium]
MALNDCRPTMRGCTCCSYCKFITLAHVKSSRFASGCPSIAYKGFHTYSAGGRLSAALSLVEGRTNYTHKFKEIVYQCQLCGLCDIACKLCRYDMDVLDTFHELRFKMVEDGQTLPQHASLIAKLHEIDCMSRQPLVDQGTWAQGLEVNDLSETSGSILFHAGCESRSDNRMRKVARDAVTVLKNAGVDIGIMGKAEHCCGAKAYDIGYKSDFDRCVQNNLHAWTKAGVRTVVTSCSNCYFAFKRLYPKYAASNIEVVHTIEFLYRLIREGRITFSRELPLTITYHDPCHLGRLGEPYVPWNGVVSKVFGQIIKHVPSKPRYNGARGVYEPPREVLRSIPGLKLIEMQRTKENAWCCGAGGGVNEAYPEFSLWTASERIEEAKSTKADALVSACLQCERNFMDAIRSNGETMKVYDIVELVQLAL